MIISRGALLGRIVATGLMRNNGVKLVAQSQRKGHTWSYRTGTPPHSKSVLVTANVVGAFMWWWILWHLYHEYQHITGEFDYPDPSKWTNAELGIPPDDVE